MALAGADAGVLGVVAGLLWVAGIVVLIVGVRQLPPDIEGVFFTLSVGAPAYSGVSSCSIGYGAVRLLHVGIVLVGVAGVLTGGLVLRHRRRRAG